MNNKPSPKTVGATFDDFAQNSSDIIIKMSESQTSAGNVSSFQVFRLSRLILAWDMLNKFCLHVYDQKCQVVRMSGCHVVRLSNLTIGTC